MGMDSEGNFYCDERCNNLIMESTEFKNFINELKQKKESSNEIKCKNVVPFIISLMSKFPTPEK